MTKFKYCKDEGCEILTDFINNKLVPLITPDMKVDVVKTCRQTYHRYTLNIYSSQYEGHNGALHISIWQSEALNNAFEIGVSDAFDHIDNVTVTNSGASKILGEYADTVREEVDRLSSQKIVLKAALLEMEKKIRNLKVEHYYDDDVQTCVYLKRQGAQYTIGTDGIVLYLIREGEDLLQIPIADPDCSKKLKKALKDDISKLYRAKKEDKARAKHIKRYMRVTRVIDDLDNGTDILWEFRNWTLLELSEGKKKHKNGNTSTIESVLTT
jgi:hypothetical protein